ncbi:hypothetical protein GCM10027176_11800 [Actinoallomurus bryophytorum]
MAGHDETVQRLASLTLGVQAEHRDPRVFQVGQVAAVVHVPEDVDIAEAHVEFVDMPTTLAEPVGAEGWLNHLSPVS